MLLSFCVRVRGVVFEKAVFNDAAVYCYFVTKLSLCEPSNFLLHYLSIFAQKFDWFVLCVVTYFDSALVTSLV